ncbi:hypothetical protein PMAYCL1PPCAC_06479, partial [Pristionchus mayeri]
FDLPLPPSIPSPSRILLSSMTRCPEKHRRNERERQRVHQVNEMFSLLRHSVRLSPDKRLNKAEALRFAIAYITHLKKMLENAKVEMSLLPFIPLLPLLSLLSQLLQSLLRRRVLEDKN